MAASSSQNIISTFLQAAAEYSNATALAQNGQSVSYRQLKEEMESIAAYYASRGIAKGDMVLVFVPMSLPLYRIVLGLFYLGACPVFLDEWVSIGRLKECLKVVPCKAIIAPPLLLALSLFIAPLRRIPVKIAAGKTGRHDTALRLASAEVECSDTALVTFTTGSTGTPKAADRTHAYLFAQLSALKPLLSDVASPCLTLLPIVVLLHLAMGKTAVLPPKRFKAKKPATIRHLQDAIVNSRPQSIIASPAIVSMLIQEVSASPDEATTAALHNIRSVLTGGGPVYPDLAQQMLDHFPEAVITAVYGSTEAEPISHIAARQLSAVSLETMLSKGLPLGLPDEAAEVKILALDANPGEQTDSISFEQHLRPHGVAGEIIVSGSHVLQHYINNPLAEAQTKFRVDGKLWHRTGDCGLPDENGQLYLLGRCNEIVVWNGRQHYPAIISYCLRALASVSDSALVLSEHNPLLILQASDKALLPQVIAVLARLGLTGASIRFIRKIPKDPRHQTKVNYEHLRRLKLS